MNDKLNELASEFYEKAEALEAKLAAIREEISKTESEAHARGFAEGLAAQAMDFDRKTIVVKVPEGRVEETSYGINSLVRKLNCQFVVVADYTDLKDLHDLELKALGLKRDV